MHIAYVIIGSVFLLFALCLVLATVYFVSVLLWNIIDELIGNLFFNCVLMFVAWPIAMVFAGTLLVYPVSIAVGIGMGFINA